MIKHVLLDLDDTSLDFHKAERLALAKTLRQFGIEPTEECTARYSEINRSCWQKLERGELTRPEVLLGRFELFLKEFPADARAEELKKCYEANLSEGHYYMPGAEELLDTLYPLYDLYLASNGAAHVQAGRIKSAGIAKYFKDMFVSEKIGADKPSRAFFDAAFARIEGFCPECAVIIGDSLSSDIMGGINAGIATVWYNPKGLPVPQNITPTHVITSLAELPELLASM